MSTESQNKTLYDQRELIKAIAEGNLTLSEALVRAGVTRRQLTRWLRARTFNADLLPVRLGLRNIRLLERELRDNLATSKSATSVRLCKPQAAPQATIDKIVEDRGREDCRQQEETVATPPCRQHPDVTDQASQELLERMATAMKKTE